MRLFVLAVALLCSVPTYAVCTRSFFDNTSYHISVSPLDKIADVTGAGRMEFITGFNKAGIMPWSKLVWAYDTFESAPTTVYLGWANRNSTRLFSRRNKRNCFVTINIGGVSSVNGFYWSVAASGFASLATAVAEAPDMIHLNNAVVTYAGTTEWADVVITRLK